MNILIRQMLTAVGGVLLLSVCILVFVFSFYPLDHWELLWNRKVMNFPFILFLLSSIIGFGLLVGVFSGLYWRHQIKEIDDQLFLLQQGRAPEQNSVCSIQEFATLVKRIQQVHLHISEQIKLSQKRANEKASNQEKQIQEVISQERNRLARELHDSVSQQLFAASMLMSAITESKVNIETAEAKQLKMVEAMIHQSQLEMRALLLHLRPVALHDKSLQEGIQELLVELTQKVPMEITWKLDPIKLEKGIEDHLFRIVQESVSNTLRHAKASSLEVLLFSRDDLLILRVMDNGVGFSVDDAKTGSYGLQNMYERAVEIGGTMKMISLPNQGTQLEVKIPLLLSGGDLK